MELSARNAALIVVDMQNGFCRPNGSVSRIGLPWGELAKAIAPCASLIAVAHAVGIRIIYTRYVYRADFADGGVLVKDLMPELKREKALVSGSWDAEIVDELAPRAEDFIIDKNRPSSFYGTMLESYLNGFGIRQLVVCGVTTNCCVETTVRDASQRDYQTFVVSDAVAEFDAERHTVALKSMGMLFAKVIHVADVKRAWGQAQAAE